MVTRTGTDGNDTLNGSVGDDILKGSSGNDLLQGSLGVDTADYGALDRAITLERAGRVNKGSLGNDQILDIERIIGASGQRNAIDGSTGTSGETSFSINLGTKRLTVNDVPTRGDLTFTVENFVDVIGTTKGDNIAGNSQDNRFSGGDGSDGLAGGDGNDTINGDNGNDFITGGNGNDILVGGLDGDLLAGGAGEDTFRYNSIDDSTSTSRDTIDFQQGSDKIDLSAIDADGNVFGNQALTFIGTRSFTAAPFNSTNGQVRYDAANNLIQAELQGDNDLIADLEIKSSVDFASLSASDFVL